MWEERHLFGLLCVLAIALIGAISACAVAAVGWALWPRRAEAVRVQVDAGFNGAFLVGMANVVVYAIAFVVLERYSLGQSSLPVFAVWTGALLLSALPGVAASFGERVLASGSTPHEKPSVLRSSFVGVVSIAGAGMVPYANVVLLFLVGVTASGAGLTALVQSLSTGDVNEPAPPLPHADVPQLPAPPVEEPAHLVSVEGAHL